METFGPTCEPTREEVEQERSYWAHQDMRHEAAEAQIRELEAHLADLEEWVGELADDLLERMGGAA